MSPKKTDLGIGGRLFRSISDGSDFQISRTWALTKVTVSSVLSGAIRSSTTVGISFVIQRFIFTASSSVISLDIFRLRGVALILALDIFFLGDDFVGDLGGLISAA